MDMLSPTRRGRRARRKGNDREREVTNRHVEELGVHAERFPASGATRFRGGSHDVDVYAFGRDEAPLVAEVKARKAGKGFTTLERWLGKHDLLFLRRDYAEPLVVLPWRIWARLLKDRQT